MSWSLGEIRNLSIKATRSLGFAWGLCEEAAYATYWLQTAGLPGARALAQFLEEIDHRGDDPHALSDTCPIQIGVQFSDLDSEPPAKIQNLRQPALLIPFVANCQFSIEGTLQWDKVICQIRKEGVGLNVPVGEILCKQADCIWTPGHCDKVTANWYDRVPDSEADAVRKLEQLASRTYAPATEASRLKGAGAGTTDND